MKNIFLFASISFSFISCGQKTPAPEQGSAVSGTFTLYTDEAFFPLANVLSNGYMAVYPQVVITIDTSGRGNAYSKLADPDIRAVISGSPVSTTDSVALSQRKIYPQAFHFASDALVLITQKTKDTLADLYFKELKGHCLREAVTPSPTGIVTDAPGSENNLYMASLLSTTENCQSGWYAVGNQKEILNRVISSTGEVGIVGLSYLSEKHDPNVKKLKSLVSIIPFTPDQKQFIYPSQSEVSTGVYPLVRKLYLATSEPYAGPATGFAAFIASAEGQRIIRMFGLVPAKTPPREIYVP